ncbi:MAG: hypothetical protein EP318_15440 [Rhodobacteraceae bacterium]|nr:MAG: hypothetical protein EP318_15440 [Paracoccaceae bacterium]
MKNVRFVKNWRQYQRGERASFVDEIAAQLMAGDDPVAVDPDSPRARVASVEPDGDDGASGAGKGDPASDIKTEGDDGASKSGASKSVASSGEPPVQGKRK